ncbi:glycosyltransferase family 1 protein [Vibrio cholerae]|nr:DUF1972 domain-containing protein [Vibrio cholerae]
MKNVAIVGIVGIPACYGGFESLVENLTKYKNDDVNYTVFCSSSGYLKRDKTHNNSRLIYIPLNANGIQSVLYDIFSLVRCFFLKPDSILILGVSGCVFLPFFRIFSKAKIITNIDGLEWKRDKWNTLAKKFLKFSEFMAIKFSDVIITDNKAIGDYVLQEYKRDNVTIAYGGDHAIRSSDGFSYIEGYALSICRIEPENNVHLILDAFAKLSTKLKFIGNWDHNEYGRNLRKKYSTFDNIELMDPVYDLDELYKIRNNSSIYIHGHSAGGTNPSLVEMMHFGKPILAYDCNFNRYSTENLAKYFSESSDIREVISNQNNLELQAIGEKMFEIAQRRYTWKEIARLYELLY